MNTIVTRLLFGFLLCFFPAVSYAQTDLADCRAALYGDTLIIGNSRIERKWLWNQGDVIPVSMTDKRSGQAMQFPDRQPAFRLPGRKFLRSSEFGISPVPASHRGAAHLAVRFISHYEGVDLQRVFRIYPHLPAISVEPSLKYTELKPPAPEIAATVDGVEAKGKVGEALEQTYLERFPLPSKHWVMRAVTFVDQTDVRDNLVSEVSFMPYSAKLPYAGNLLLANDLLSGRGFFLLKEAPNTTSQLHYSGADFLVSNTDIRIPFSGFPEENGAGGWLRGYPLTTGVTENGPDQLLALREYLKGSINYDPAAYDMVMMNTWGDRGRDGKITEKFILRELEGAARLGITHFQIDDGWQQGLSKNSSSAAGNLWGEWSAEHWQVHPERFPEGLTNIIASAKDKNIALGLWFNPSFGNDYATWKRDADIIIGLYRQTGIRYYKIDGVSLPTKESEVNFGKFLDEVKTATDGQVFFNLDLTAGVRGGYFSFRNAGNLFLENRYTDWGNYYPYRTLRNLWMLARYFPPELIQTEFLNKWRNPEKYPPGDPFAPINYSFDYLFAITMMGQPLAWMEAANLPEAAFGLAEQIRTYRSVMADIHGGTILPIGAMPSGRSWTGFQSLQSKSGYLLVFREQNDSGKTELATYLPAGKKVKFQLLLGDQKGVKCKAKADGKIEVTLPRPNSYALFKYRLGD